MSKPASAVMKAFEPGHGPLSDRIVEILGDSTAESALTLNCILRRTQGRGIYLLIVLLCFPFLTPVTIPGVSVLVGTVIFILAVRMAVNRPQVLPQFVGEKTLPEGFKKALCGSVGVLRFLERWLIRPRRTSWMSWGPIRSVNALVLALVASLLVLPIPPVIPLSNTLPGYAILLIALSMMEEDGAMIWVGYGVTAGTVAYFMAWADMILSLALRFYGPVWHWLQGLA